jgi:hypothetical protein
MSNKRQRDASPTASPRKGSVSSSSSSSGGGEQKAVSDFFKKSKTETTSTTTTTTSSSSSKVVEKKGSATKTTTTTTTTTTASATGLGLEVKHVVDQATFIDAIQQLSAKLMGHVIYACPPSFLPSFEGSKDLHDEEK